MEGRRRSIGQRGAQWVLLGIAVLLLVALIRGWRLGRQESAAPALHPPVQAGEGASITALLLRQERDTLRLERRAGIWWMTAPVADLASDRLVRELFRALEGLEVIRVLETGERQRYGLAPPASELLLVKASGDSIQMALGARTPASSAYYATWTGLEGVALVPGFIAARFFQSAPFLWREHEILPAAAGKIDSVWIDAGGTRTRVRRLGRDDWKLTAPLGHEVDRLSVGRTVAAFWRFPYTGFFDEPGQAKTLGLDPPRARWHVFRGGLVDTVAIGKLLESGEMVVQLSGRPPGRVPGELYERLTGGLRALETRAFVRGSPKGVRFLLLATREGGRCLRREGRDWWEAELLPAQLAVMETSVMPETTQLAWERASDPALGPDVDNLFALQGEQWLAPLSAAPNPGAYDLRIHLWEADGIYRWVYFRATQKPAEEIGGPPRFVGIGVGSRFPGRPLTFSSAVVWRWWLRAEG
ncbi:MAG: DUF4340 domain-containing protein [Candidatus Eisenbacteria sp.]|nr:DUF4340 domain-containing protein [Candidatus Eisenbacteria bacterium]